MGTGRRYQCPGCRHGFVAAGCAVCVAAARASDLIEPHMHFVPPDHAKQVVFLKRSMRPGFAGIENELLFEEKTSLLFGDAKDTMSKLLNAVKAL